MITATTQPPSPRVAVDFHALVHALLPLWPLGVLMLVVGLGKLVIDVLKLRRLSRAGMSEIDAMNGSMFERRLEVLFRQSGYDARVVAGVGDYGADLILVRDGKKTVVQAKCWRSRSVGVTAIQEVVAARGHYGADAALVVTNAHFTANAKVLAKSNQVALWDRETLIDRLCEVTKNPKPSSSAAELQPAVAGAPAQPANAAPGPAFCARCGAGVSERVRMYCASHPARFAGLVYCYSHQREVRA